MAGFRGLRSPSGGHLSRPEVMGAFDDTDPRPATRRSPRGLFIAATWALGLWLAWHGPDSRYGWFASGWLGTKLVLVLALSGLHGFFARWVRDFAADANRRSQRFYRIINEVPTILMIAIVILAVVKPF